MKHKFWKYGFCIHAGVAAFIAMSAYLGILPTTSQLFPHFDLFAHFILVGLLAFFLGRSVEISPRNSWENRMAPPGPGDDFLFCRHRRSSTTLLTASHVKYRGFPRRLYRYFYMLVGGEIYCRVFLFI